MPSPAPAPRLPLEPADRPLYRRPARVGCSGLSLVCVVALLAFLVFRAVVAPALTARIAAIQLPAGLVPALATPTPTPAGGALEGNITALPAPELTPTLTAAPTDTVPPVPPPPSPSPVPPPSPTAAAPEYVIVANTDGTGVYLRADPRPDARRIFAMTEKTLLLIVGPDTIVNAQVWRNVRTTRGTPQTGWVLAQYLAPSPGP